MRVCRRLTLISILQNDMTSFPIAFESSDFRRANKDGGRYRSNYNLSSLSRKQFTLEAPQEVLKF